MWAVIELSVRKMREGSFYLLLAVGALICVLADAADPLSNQIDKASLFGYALSGASVSVPPITAGSGIGMLLAVLLAVFFGCSEIPGEIGSGLVQVVLSKPVGRVRYLLGKYFATLLLTWEIYFLFEAVLVGCHFAFGTGNSAYTWAQIARQWLPPLALPMLVAVALTFSLLAGAMGGMVTTTVYLLFSAVVSFMPVTLALFPKGMIPGLNEAMTVCHYLFPNLLYYMQDSVNGWLMIGAAAVYSVSVTTLFLAVAAFRIRRMDLNVVGA